MYYDLKVGEVGRTRGHFYDFAGIFLNRVKRLLEILAHKAMLIGKAALFIYSLCLSLLSQPSILFLENRSLSLSPWRVTFDLCLIYHLWDSEAIERESSEEELSSGTRPGRISRSGRRRGFYLGLSFIFFLRRSFLSPC